MSERQLTVEIDDGCELAVRVAGTDGEAVLLLHGGPGWPDYLGALAQRLAGNWRVHRFDQRGCGSSSRTRPWTVDRYLADLHRLRHVLDVDRWHVIGHSWGANYGLLHALDAPHHVRTLTYLSGNGLQWRDWYEAYVCEVQQRLLPSEQQRFDELRATTYRSQDEEVEFLELVLSTDSGAPETYAAEIRAVAHRVASIGINYELNRTLNAEFEAMDRADLRQRCEVAATATLVLHGTADPRPTEAVAHVAEWLPNARLQELEGVGHNLQMEALDRTTELIARHLRG